MTQSSSDIIALRYILPVLRITSCLHTIGPTPSVLWLCWWGGRKGIRPVKNWVVGCWRGCLGWGADLHIAQQMPLPLTISCCSKSRLVLPFSYLLTRVVPDRFQQSSKTVVCVCTYHGASEPGSSMMLHLEEFARWRYQLDVRQLQCLVEFVKMRHYGAKSAIYDWLVRWRTGCAII